MASLYVVTEEDKDYRRTANTHRALQNLFLFFCERLH